MSAKLLNIKHCKFDQVSLSSNKFDLWVFIFFSVILLILVLPFFSTCLLLTLICKWIQLASNGREC